MFVKQSKIVEKICEIPVTLGDISENILEGINTKNSLLHRLYLPEEGGSDSYYLCEGLCKPVFIEPEIVYPYVSGAFSEKFAFRPSPYRFMLPYELSTVGKKNEYNVIPPEELKTRFPMAYGRILEFKRKFLHDTSPLKSSDYSIKGRRFLEYFNTPKIIATEGYHLQAAYDAEGNHVFENGCGIVLKDPERYAYITAVLNSSIARLFPSVCKSEMIYPSYVAPVAMKHFPIVFPDNMLTEDLITTISGYLAFLNREKYARDYGVPNWLRELTSFYEQISNLLVLDTYFINDIDPGLLDALEENIHPYSGDMNSEDSGNILNALYYIKHQILEASSPEKYKFNLGLPGTLNFSQSNEKF
ncbi:hypothetical protein [Methanosarcina barkeri]|uniref:Uncharacterized protein n=2 Tax=Methanosarcina barkeri TaxID=2208 RepID=A0A0E3QSH5_METBA|nr:hypothetical protein [Methanosarcina barkeri]AKB53519.1 hypothetical protein MSBRM_0521 [Methanosarcina barkeri MS]AKB58372.1 hypothetical protein MSBR2_1856 [Methanosarcina barkeri 227]